MENAALVEQLGTLVEQGGAHNRLVVSSGPAFLVFRGARGGHSLSVEAAASQYLPEDMKLGGDAVATLRARGFSSRSDSRCLARELPLADVQAELPLLLALFQQVYGRPAGERLEPQLHLVDQDVDNSALLDAMRELASTRAEAQRHALYRQALRATFLLPLEGGQPRSFGDLGGWQILAVFTDLASLNHFDPRGLPYELVKGSELFPRLMKIRMGSLLINPNARVGGELFRHEVESLASAAQRTRRT